jgi:hypothetical protein
MHVIVFARHTASALTMMRQLRVGHKVGCHRAVAEMFTIVFCRIQRFDCSREQE